MASTIKLDKDHFASWRTQLMDTPVQVLVDVRNQLET